MSLAPVFYTLAQVKFNPITQMVDYVPRLQDRLRRSGYPDFRREDQLELAIRRLDEPQPEVQNQKHVRWSFTNAQRTEGYLLLSDALVFHTTDYDTFQDFSKKALDGLSLVHEVIELAYVERIGLRYLDAIAPATDDNIEDYLNPSLLGLSSTIGGTLTHSFTETLAQVDGGTLVARALITESGLALSPDLFPLQLQLQPRFSALTARTGVLDTDYFVTQRFDFDIKRVEKQFRASHNIVIDVFHASVTDHARKAWE